MLEVNELQPLIIVQMAEERLGILKGKKIAILGLAFKPDTDDVRESRSEIVVKELMDKGAEIVGHDPEAMDNFKELIEVNTVPSVEEAIEKADCVILMTEWKEYTKINLKMLRNRMSGNVIIDGRQAFNPEQIEKAGFDYRTIGLG